jgi:hypothetical protein
MPTQSPAETIVAAAVAASRPKRTWLVYKAGPVEFWLTEAATQFINGFIAGWKHGVGTGAGTGALTGANPDLAAALTAWQQILISGGATLLAMFMSGMTQVSRWHETNPFPNPYPAPGGTTAPFNPTS